jgi:3-dehydroquinate dehydratase-2
LDLVFGWQRRSTCSTGRTLICSAPAAETYGHHTLADVEKLCHDTAALYGLTADCRQSNREGELIDFVHEAGAKKAAGIIINAGGYSTSIALHDALMAVKLPTVEVHVSNIFAREPFRHHSFVSSAAVATLCGFGSTAIALPSVASPRGSAPRRKPDRSKSVKKDPDFTWPPRRKNHLLPRKSQPTSASLFANWRCCSMKPI